MKKEQNEKYSLYKTLKSLYFSKLIQINSQKQTSIAFAISIELLRFLFGQSLVYSVFIIQNYDNTANRKLLLQLKHVFGQNQIIAYQYLQLTCICLLFVIIIYSTLIFFTSLHHGNLYANKILYFIGSYLKVSSEFLFCVFSIVVYKAIKTSNYYMIVIVFIQMVLMLLLFKVSAIFQQKNKFETDDLYVHNENLTVEIHNIFFSLICFIGPLFILLEVPEFVRIMIMILWICLQIIRMKQTVIYPYYQHEIVYKMYVCVVSLQTSQIAINTLIDLLQFQMIKNNALPAIGIITFFACWGILNSSRFNVEKCYFLSPDQIKSKKYLHLFINSYYSVISALQKSSDVSQIYLIVSSIKKNHQNSCKKPKCYCHDDSQIKEFMELYLYQMLLKLQITFSHDFSIILFIYSLKFHVYKNYIKTYQQLEILERKKQLNLIESLLVTKLKQELYKWIKQKNIEFKVISIYQAINLQKDMSILNEIILNDIQVKYKKWNIFSKELARIQQVKNLSQKEIQNLIKVWTIKQKKWKIYNKSPSFNITLYFYFKKIALKNNDLNEFEQNIKSQNKRIKEEQYGTQNLFAKYLFHAHTCTVQCSIKQSNIGIITNASKSISKVFGYKRKQIIGENISILTPQFLRKQLMMAMKQLITSQCQISQISKSQEINFQHKQNYTFSAQKYMMVYTRNQQVTFNITYVKKNQNNIVLINSEFQLQSYGKAIKQILNGTPDKIFCDYVFKGLKSKLANADLVQQKHQKTIIFNSKTINKFLNKEKTLQSNEKKRLNSQSSKSQLNSVSDKHNDSKSMYSHLNVKEKEIFYQSTIQYQNIWKTDIIYKKIQLVNQVFYKIEMKNLQFIQTFNQISQKQLDYIQTHSNFIDDDNLSNQDIVVDEDVEILKIEKQQNSSMTSMSSQLGFGISKLIQFFTSILMNPSKLTDKRIKMKYFVDFIFLFILIGIISTTLILNKYSLQQKITSLKAKASINKVLQLFEVSTNHVFTIYMYRNDPKMKQIAIDELTWDSQSFLNELNQHIFIINQQITFFQGQILYNYVKTPLGFTFKKMGTKQIQLLQWFQLFLYLFDQIKKQMKQQTINMTSLKQLYKMLAVNATKLRTIRDTLSNLTYANIANDDIFNRNYLIITLIFFFFSSAFYAFYVNNYRSFRFHQKQDHIKLYQMIPNQILKNLTQYYTTYYKHFITQKNEIDAFLNGSNQIFELQFQQNKQTQQLIRGNKLKVIGKKKYLLWIPIFLSFLVLNGGNAAISYSMYKFNKQVEFFSKLANNLSASESIVVTRWLRFKSTYYFDRSNITIHFLQTMKAFVNSSQVQFNKYATFQQNWVTSGDTSFRQQFNKLLITSPCVLNQADLTSYQLQICNQQGILSKNGIIVFVNNLNRALKNVIIKWQSKLAMILSQSDAFINEKQFKQVDFASTFHVDTFNKLNSLIISVYENGFNTQYQIYVIIFAFLIIQNVLFFLWNIRQSFEDKIQLSYLYGYVLLFPSSTLKHSKYLLKFIQTNLQFEVKH